ncbi:hypothetical protein B5S33_g4456 [[Candida] boidinii]|nr:hypothetical protein B5S30_g3834 [[Candida] boidinii]OWB85784.1 hypothetical protein B5S33_g4456 [[Candida] boidinii]
MPPKRRTRRSNNDNNSTVIADTTNIDKSLEIIEPKQLKVKKLVVNKRKKKLINDSNKENIDSITNTTTTSNIENDKLFNQDSEIQLKKRKILLQQTEILKPDSTNTQDEVETVEQEQEQQQEQEEQEQEHERQQEPVQESALFKEINPLLSPTRQQDQTKLDEFEVSNSTTTNLKLNSPEKSFNFTTSLKYKNNDLKQIINTDKLLESPDKTINPSRMSSPLRKTESTFLPSDSTINQLFQKKDLKNLTSILTELTNTKSERMLIEFKKTAEKRFNTSDKLISNLTKEITYLKTQLSNQKREKSNESVEINKLKSENESLLEKIESLNSNNEVFKIEIEKNLNLNENIIKEKNLNNTKFEIIELLTGLTCIEFHENQENLSFKLKQTGDSCILYYQLLISKNGSSDIVYIPDLDNTKDIEDSSKNKENLKTYLPDYLLDNLTFPANTLNNFFSKLSRSLNKKN